MAMPLLSSLALISPLLSVCGMLPASLLVEQNIIIICIVCSGEHLFRVQIGPDCPVDEAGVAPRVGPLDRRRLVVAGLTAAAAAVHRTGAAAGLATAQGARGVAAQCAAVVGGVGAELLVLQVQHRERDVEVLRLGRVVVGGADAAASATAAANRLPAIYKQYRNNTVSVRPAQRASVR